MKILIVNTFYYPNLIGGTENSIKLLAEGLVKQNHKVAIYTADNFENNISKEIINGVEVYRTKAGYFDIKARLEGKDRWKKIKNKIIEIKNKKITTEFEYIIKEFKPDVIHTNNIFGISPYIWELSKKHNIKLVHTLRDYWLLAPNTDYNPDNQKIYLDIYRKYFRRKTKIIDYVTAPSNYTLKIFNEFDYFEKAKKVHISNAVIFDEKNLKKIITERDKSKNEIIQYLFVGMLTEKKGINILIDTFMRIKNEKIRLNIVGSGELKDSIIKKIVEDKRITYIRQLNKNELAKEFEKNDVLVIPSIWEEPFGRVIIEANSYGLPVIGSNRGGIPEIIQKVGCGALYNTEEELEALIKKFSSREVIKKYYNNILQNTSLYSEEKNIEKFMKIYSE